MVLRLTEQIHNCILVHQQPNARVARSGNLNAGRIWRAPLLNDDRVFLCPEELTMPPQLTAGRLYYTDTYQDGDKLTLAGTGFTVLRTPGHTPGSVCLLAEDVMFSGDTLFAGSCGRTDLPGGNASRMKASLARIAALEGDYRVLPGHGGVTTLEHERKNNPYLSL